MTPAYAVQLGLEIRSTNVSTQKIDSLGLKTYGMVTIEFLFYDKLGKIWFFEKIFLLANTNIEVVLRMPFFFLNNADVKFMNAKGLI